jgi:tetratricopeptide (TPR) repeat protein
MDAMLRRTIWVFSLTAVLYGQVRSDAAHDVVADLKSGKYVEAERLLETALKTSPRDARLWTLNGLALQRLDRRREASAAFDRALRIAPDYVPALEGAAQIAYEDGDAKAITLLDRIVSLRPGDHASHAMLAQIAFKAGNCESAKTEFAMSEGPGTSEAGPLREYGDCLIAAKRASEAVPVFERLRELEPQSDTAIYDCAVAKFLAGHFTETVAALNSLRRKDADAYDLAAEAYEASGKREEASEAMRRAIAMDPNEPRYYADFAYLSQANGEFQQGLAVLDQGIERKPDVASLYVARGVLYSELGQYERGEADFERAQKLDPNVELVSAAQGLSELQRNDLPQAEKTIRTRLARQPNDAFLHYLLAEVLLRQGAAPPSPAFDEALRSARTAVKLKPDLGLARDTLSLLYLEQGKLNDAIEQSRLAYQSNPNDEKALYHLVTALRKANQTAELPALLQRLVLLRAETRTTQVLENKHNAP